MHSLHVHHDMVMDISAGEVVQRFAFATLHPRRLEMVEIYEFGVRLDLTHSSIPHPQHMSHQKKTII